jgi:hypothetical protein
MDAIRRLARRFAQVILRRRNEARKAGQAGRRRRPSPVWSFVNIPASSRVDTVASVREARKNALRPLDSPLRRRLLEAVRAAA